MSNFATKSSGMSSLFMQIEHSSLFLIIAYNNKNLKSAFLLKLLRQLLFSLDSSIYPRQLLSFCFQNFLTSLYFLLYFGQRHRTSPVTHG